MSKVIKHFPVPHVICFLFSDIPPSRRKTKNVRVQFFTGSILQSSLILAPFLFLHPRETLLVFLSRTLQRSVFISRRRNILQPSQNFALEYALGIKVFLTKEKKIFREFVVFDLLKNLRNNNSFLDFSIFFVSLYETTLI